MRLSHSLRRFMQVYADLLQVHRGLRKVYAWFTQGLYRVYARFTQGLRKVYAEFTQGLRRVYALFMQSLRKCLRIVYAEFTQSLRRVYANVYARFTQGLRKVYARFTQIMFSLRKVYAGLRSSCTCCVLLKPRKGFYRFTQSLRRFTQVYAYSA